MCVCVCESKKQWKGRGGTCIKKIDREKTERKTRENEEGDIGKERENEKEGRREREG